MFRPEDVLTGDHEDGGGTAPIVVEEQSGSRLRRGEQFRQMPGHRLVRAATSTKLFLR